MTTEPPNRLADPAGPRPTRAFLVVVGAAIVMALLGAIGSSSVGRWWAAIGGGLLGAWGAGVLVAPEMESSGEEGGFYRITPMPLFAIIVAVDVVLDVVADRRLAAWSPGVWGIPLATLLFAAEIRRFVVFRRGR